MNDITVTDKAKQRWIVACAAFATFMGTLDEFIVGISLPKITEYFHVGTSQSVWIVIIYFLIVTSTLILFGKLADRMGLKKLFIIGYWIFIAGSLFCGISWNIEVLIAARFIQGIGGAILRVVAYAIVPKFLPSEIRGWGFGILSTASASGIMIGAPAGGFIISYFSWHWIFLVNIPIGIAAVFVVCRVLPVESTGGLKKKFDIPGAVLSLAGISLFTYALNMGHELGWTSAVILVAGGLSVVLMIAFVVWEGRVSDPLMDMSLFRNRKFVYGNISMFMTCMYMSGDSFLLPFYLQLSKGLTPYLAGLVLLGYSIVYVPTSQIAGRLSDKISPPVLCGFAMLSGTGACLLFIMTLDQSSIFPLFIYIAWAAVSCAMFISPCNNNVMANAPQDKQGSASGILSTANQLSGVVGVCLFEAIFSAFSESTGKTTLEHVQTSPQQMLVGFRNAYILALSICFLSMFFSFIARDRKSTKPESISQQDASLGHLH